jgi:schlafen family protein
LNLRGGGILKSAYYQASHESFLCADENRILGELSQAHHFDLNENQRDAWLTQINVLKNQFGWLDRGLVFFEFAIPRMGKRADVVLLVDGVVFVIEFKAGAAAFDRSSIDQVHDYALDLKNFHRGSHDRLVVPVLVATDAPKQSGFKLEWAADGVAAPLRSSGHELSEIVRAVLADNDQQTAPDSAWAASGYLPTPTIIEAAQALYQKHDVQEIARSDASAQNLNATTVCINKIVEDARREKTKAICFVTGVPGSGKTLAGLNIATQSASTDSDQKAVFLSGNGPLVTVLREALARDQTARTGCRKKDAAREVASFVQNIHHFRDEALRDLNAPPEKVVIFDEAQRAWNRDQASKFMQTKRGQKDFNQSEPEFLISVMDRHYDWCVIICLVGGGQEINSGEAGLSEWMHALTTTFVDWKVYLSNRLSDPQYALSEQAETIQNREAVFWKSDLHLGVSLRSFRAESLSKFVERLLDNRPEEAASALRQIHDRYPVVMTRNIERAREWLKEQGRGTERFGLIASSGAYRLRAEGVNVRAKIDPANWFLNSADDVRSAYYLEEVATEFDIQGLEIDWACVCWDADLRFTDDNWRHFAFKGTRWQNVTSNVRQQFLKNAYRVILTRARQGMVVFVPKGDPDDPTRPPSYYDQTAEYLYRAGIPSLD